LEKNNSSYALCTASKVENQFIAEFKDVENLKFMLIITLYKNDYKTLARGIEIIKVGNLQYNYVAV